MRKKTKKKVQEKLHKTKNNEGFNVWILCIIGLGIILRLVFPIMNTGLWHDECAVAINILDRDFWGLFNPLRFLQVAPPLFLSAVKLPTLLINPLDNPAITDFVLRLVPLLSGIASVFAFYYLLKNLFTNKYIQFIGVCLFALNPLLIQYSYELKPYSTDVLVTILLLIYFIKYNPDSYIKQFYQILIISLSMLVSFPAGFVIFAGILRILFKDYKKFFYALTAFGLVVIFYFIYHIWGVMEANGAGMDKYWFAYFINVNNFVQLATLFVKNTFNIFVLPLVTLGVIIAGFLVSCFRDYKIAVITFFVITSIFVASYLHLYPFADRMLLFLVPVLIILCCELFDIIPIELSKVLPIIFVLLACYNLYTMSSGLINKINIKTNIGIGELAQHVLTNGYSVVIPKNSNVEWIYYSRFYNFDSKKVYFQEWNTKDKEFFASIPKNKYYYFAPFEINIPQNILQKAILLGHYRILRVD